MCQETTKEGTGLLFCAFSYVKLLITLCMIIGFRVGNSPIWLPSHSASVGVLQCRADQASVAGTAGQHRATCAGACVRACVRVCVCVRLAPH